MLSLPEHTKLPKLQTLLLIKVSIAGHNRLFVVCMEAQYLKIVDYVLAFPAQRVVRNDGCVDILIDFIFDGTIKSHEHFQQLFVPAK